MWVQRCMIVPDDLAETCRGMAYGLAGESGANMWTVPLSPTGEAPATHWISVGLIGDEFAALMADPALLADAAGISEAEAAGLMSQCDVSDEDWPTASARLGLQLMSEEIAG